MQVKEIGWKLEQKRKVVSEISFTFVHSHTLLDDIKIDLVKVDGEK